MEIGDDGIGASLKDGQRSRRFLDGRSFLFWQCDEEGSDLMPVGELPMRLHEADCLTPKAVTSDGDGTLAQTPLFPLKAPHWPYSRVTGEWERLIFASPSFYG